MSPSADVAAIAVQLLMNLTVLGSSLAIGVWLAFSLTSAVSPRVRYLVSVSAFFLAALLPLLVTFQVTPERQEHSPVDFADPGFVSEDMIVAASPDDAPSVSARSPQVVKQPMAQTAWLSADTAWIVELAAEHGFGFGILCLWIIIAVLLIGREITGHVLLARERRAWRPAPPTLQHQLRWPDSIPLLIHEQVGPSAVGLLRPVVVLPSDLLLILSREAAQRVARHELDHATWRDPLVNALLRLLRAVLWPSLPLWFLERVIRFEREAAADQAAIRSPQSAGEKDLVVTEYASALVSMARWTEHVANRRLRGLTATNFGARVGLEARVRRLLITSQRLPRARLSLAGGAILAGVLGTAFLPVASPSRSAAKLTPVHAQGDFSGRKRTENAPEFQPGFAGRVKPMVGELARPPVKPKAIINEQKPAKSETVSSFTPDELARMQARDTTPEYVQSIRRRGYEDVTAAQLIKMKKLGITEEFIKAWQDLGYDKPPAEKLIKLRKLAIDVELARKLRESGLSDLTLDRLIKMKKGFQQVSY